MDAKLLSPFVDSVFQVLPQFGLQDVSRGTIAIKDNLSASREVTAIIGLTKGIRGNIAYCMSGATAKAIASAMMMGMPVAELDEMARSAISELSNMIAAGAASLFEKNGMVIDISPPTLVVGDEVFIRISQVKTLTVEVKTSVGPVELNIGLEV